MLELCLYETTFELVIVPNVALLLKLRKRLELGNTTRCLASGCVHQSACGASVVTRARRQSLHMVPSEWVFVGSLDSSESATTFGVKPGHQHTGMTCFP
nr:hypothetical protein [Tanacetum cinerariifolium]